MEKKIIELSKILKANPSEVEKCIKTSSEKHSISTEDIINTLIDNETDVIVPEKYFPLIELSPYPIFKDGAIQHFYYDDYWLTLYFYGKDHIIYKLKTRGTIFEEVEDGIHLDNIHGNFGVYKNLMVFLDRDRPMIYDLDTQKATYFNTSSTSASRIIMKDYKVAFYHSKLLEPLIIVSTLPDRDVLATIRPKDKNFEMVFVGLYFAIVYQDNISFYDQNIKFIKSIYFDTKVPNRPIKAIQNYIIIANETRLVVVRKTSFNYISTFEVGFKIGQIEVFENYIFCSSDNRVEIHVFNFVIGSIKTLRFNLLHNSDLKVNSKIGIMYVVDKLLYFTVDEIVWCIDLSKIFEKKITLAQSKVLESIFVSPIETSVQTFGETLRESPMKTPDELETQPPDEE